MTIYYVDFENGDNNQGGQSFSTRKKDLSFTSAIADYDEVRIMASPDPISIGNATWTQQETTNDVGISQVFDQGGEIKVRIISNTDYFPDDGYVLIAGSTSPTGVNGLWKTTLYSGNDYILQGSTFSSLGVASGFYTTGASMTSINGKVVRIPGKILEPINPNWSVLQTGGGASWQNTGNCVDGITNGSTYYSGSSTFQSRPQSSWRITWTTSNTISVVETAYSNDAANLAAGGSLYFNNYYGVDNYSYGLNVGYYYRHIHGYQNGTSIVINSNSYVMFNTYNGVNTGHSASNPPVRQYQIGANDSEMYQLRYRGVQTTQMSNTNDISGSNANGTNLWGYLLEYKGNRQRTGQPTDVSTVNLHWTAYFFGPAAYNKAVQINIHSNPDWEYVATQPTITAIEGGSDFNVSGSTASSAIFWENFSSALNLSSFDTLSFSFKVFGTVPNNFKLRLHLGPYDSTASYVEFALPISTTGSSFESVSLSNGSNLPSSVYAISIYYDGTSNLSGAGTFSIKDLAAISSTGLSLSKLIGINNAENPHWYKIKNIRYMPNYNETAVTIAGHSNTDENTPGSLSYYGSITNPVDLSVNSNVQSITVQTYMRDAIDLSARVEILRNRISITGGWNRTNMSTRTGQTFLNQPDSAQDAVNITNKYGVFISNIVTVGGNSSFYISGHGNELYNCGATYSTTGIYTNDADSCKFKMQSIIGCSNAGVYSRDNFNCEYIDCAIEGNNRGIDFTSGGNGAHNFYNLVLRSTRYEALRIFYSQSISFYNTTILSCAHKLLYAYASSNIKFDGGLIRTGKYQDTSNTGYYRNDQDSTVSFLGVDMPNDASYTESYVVDSTSSLYLVNQNNTDYYRYFIHGGVTLRRNSSITSPTGSLWDGSSDSGNICYKWQRVSSNYIVGYTQPEDGKAVKIGSIPLTGGTTTNISIYTLYPASNHGALSLFCDHIESSIGLTQDQIQHCYGHAPNTWSQYTMTLTAINDGVAEVYLKYWNPTTTMGVNSNFDAYWGGVTIV